jgi:hypothetical protein
VAQHVIQRGNNRQAIFHDDEDRGLFSAWLSQYARQREVLILIQSNWGQSKVLGYLRRRVIGVRVMVIGNRGQSKVLGDSGMAAIGRPFCFWENVTLTPISSVSHLVEASILIDRAMFTTGVADVKKVFTHTPNYFQFYVMDGDSKTAEMNSSSSEELVRERIAEIPSGIAISTVSEYSEIKVGLSGVSCPEEIDIDNNFDFFREACLNVPSGHLILASCPDGPVFGKFGDLDVDPGSYRLRVYYYGQNSRMNDGTSSDSYELAFWRKN